MVLWLLGYGANPLFVQAASPTISIWPSSGPLGSSILVTGFGFSANEARITVTYDGIPVASGIWADSRGAWSDTFVVPDSSPSGSHHIIDASSPSTLATTVPDITFTVTPGIDITGICMTDRTSEAAGRSITVTGCGFSANETGITVTYNGNQ